MKIAQYIIVFLVISVLVCGTGCDMPIPGFSKDVTGSGTVGSRDMDFTGFDSIDVSNAFEVIVVQGATWAVNITMDDNLFEYLETEVKSGTLYVGLKPSYRYIGGIRRVSVLMPDIEHFTLSGASKGIVSGFIFGHRFGLDISGASVMSLDGMQTGNTEMDISGASTVSGSVEMIGGAFDVSGASKLFLNGSADDIRISASGASDVDMEEFPSGNAAVDISGASHVTLNCNGVIEGEVSGASSLRYTGTHQLGNLDLSGSSTLSAK